MSDAYLTAWWYGGPESGLRERQAIESAVAARHITFDEIAGSVVELLASPDLWGSLTTLVQQSPQTPAVRGLVSQLSQLEGFAMKKSPSTVLCARSDDANRRDDDKPEMAGGEVEGRPNAIACTKCQGTGYVEPNATEKDEENDRIKAMQKSVESLRKELRAAQTRVIELETARDELENAKRALVSKLGEFQASLNNVQAQAAADAKAREDELMARTSQMHDIGCQTDAMKVSKPPPKPSSAAAARLHATPPTSSSSSPTDAELGVLNRSGLEELVAEKCAIIGELQLTRQTQSDQLDDLKRQVQTAAENLVAFNRASENAQQLLRQEITVLRDTITNLQDNSSASIRERQASLSVYLTKMKTDHMKSVMLKAPPSPVKDATAAMSPTSRELVATANQQLEVDITKLIPWSENDIQTESLAQATAQAACRAEAELDNLPIGFVQEDESADTDTLHRLSLTADSPPDELVDTIQTMAAELEAAKESARKLQTVQLHRIVTLSTHLSKVAGEMLLLRKKSGAEIAFWKTECEKLDRELQCLVTEFNLYKSNHMVDGERAVMQSLLTADQETLWSQDGPEARAFLATMREACGTSPVNPMVAKFLVLGEAVHSLADGCARPFHALKAIYDAWRDGGGSSTPRKASSKKRAKSKVVGHGKTSSDIIEASSPSKSPTKRSSAYASLPGSPVRQSSPTRRRSSTVSKPRVLPARIPTGDTAAACAAEAASPMSPEVDNAPVSTEDEDDRMVPRAFELTAVDEAGSPDAHNPFGSGEEFAEDITPPTPLDNTLLMQLDGGSPLSTAAALRGHEALRLTTQDTPPASDMAQATVVPDDSHEDNNQLLNDDGVYLDSLHAPNPAKQNPKELQYLKSLAGTRSDTLRSLAVTQWEVLILKLQLVALHARNVEMKERRVRFNRPHVAMASMTELLHQGIHRREIAHAECQQRHERLRERLKHVNLCIVHAITALFQPNGRPDSHASRQAMAGRQRLDLVDMSLIDMNHVPPSQQIPTTHFPLDGSVDTAVPPQPAHKEPPPPTMAFLMSPYKADKRFPNRVTKFQYDKDTQAYSFMHVTKLVYPKSAGPTKTPFQLKPSVQVAGIRVPPQDDGRSMLLHPKEDFDQPTRARAADDQPHPYRSPMNPYRPKSTPSYLTRGSIRQSPRQRTIVGSDADDSPSPPLVKR